MTLWSARRIGAGLTAPLTDPARFRTLPSPHGAGQVSRVAPAARPPSASKPKTDVLRNTASTDARCCRQSRGATWTGREAAPTLDSRRQDPRGPGEGSGAELRARVQGGECGKAPGDDSREGRGRRDISGLLEGGQGGQAACFWCLIARVTVYRCAPSD